MNIDGVELTLENLGQGLRELLVGERWPDGHEDAMRRLASEWSSAADELEQIQQDAANAARGVGHYLQGANGDAFQSFWSSNFDDGKPTSALPFSVRFCRAMAQALNDGATQIESTKDMIRGNIAILVTALTPRIAAGAEDVGAIAAEIAANRTAMRLLLDGAQELIARVVEEAIERGLEQAGLNFAIQLSEVAGGHASGIEFGSVGQARLAGAEGGALGTGVAAGGPANATMDPADTGRVSAPDFGKGSLAGAAGDAANEVHGSEEKTSALDTDHLTVPGLASMPEAEVPPAETAQPESQADRISRMLNHGPAPDTSQGMSTDGGGAGLASSASDGGAAGPSGARADAGREPGLGASAHADAAGFSPRVPEAPAGPAAHPDGARLADDGGGSGNGGRRGSGLISGDRDGGPGPRSREAEAPAEPARTESAPAATGPAEDPAPGGDVRDGPRPDGAVSSRPARDDAEPADAEPADAEPADAEPAGPRAGDDGPGPQADKPSGRGPGPSPGHAEPDPGRQAPPSPRDEPAARDGGATGTRHDLIGVPVPDTGGGVHDRTVAGGRSWSPRDGLPRELAEVSAHAEVSDHGIANFSDPRTAELARRVKPAPDGAFTGDIHGDAGSVFSDGTRMTPEEYLRVLDANGHEPGQPIRLLSCEAGAGDDSFALELARVSGCEVTAADTEVWSDEAGYPFASRALTDIHGEPHPGIPPTGRWHEFSPHGTKTAIGTRGFPPGHEHGFGYWTSPLGDVVSQATPEDIETARTVDRLRQEWPELDRVVTGSEVTRESLLSSPECVKTLDLTLRDVHDLLNDAGIADAVRRGDLTNDVRSAIESITGKLQARHPPDDFGTPPPGQLAISRGIKAGTTEDGYRRSGFGLSRRDEAGRTRGNLDDLARDLARDHGGDAAWRPGPGNRDRRAGPGNRDRRLAKVRDYAKEPNGDASPVDVAGAKIRFDNIDDLYRALGDLKDDPRVDILRVKDRFDNPAEGGFRGILMNARTDNGHAAELRMELKAPGPPAAHPLYEVRRDMESIAGAEGRPLEPVESLIKTAMEARVRRDFGAAWEEGNA